MTWIYLFIFMPVLLHGLDLFDAKAYAEMDQIAVQAGTDKSSNGHDYTRVYSQYFSKHREEPLTFLEIGIYHGDSVKLWEEYFPHASLHFIDIDLEQVAYHSPRAHYHKVDQSNRKELIQFAQALQCQFDIIIDDGGHRMEQITTSFHALFPFLKSGSLYIVEDLHTSYWSLYGSYGTPEKPRSGPGSAIQLFKELIDDLNYTSARTWSADTHKIPPSLQKSLTYYQKEIASIHFYKSLCIIIKK